MARNYYSQGSGDAVKWFRGKVTNIESGAAQALQDAMDDGAIMMADLISSRGTAKSGKAGRIETKKMHNDVDSLVTLADSGRVTGRMGWVRKRENYYALQEGGFEHSPGVTVEAMYALHDAADWAMQQFEEDLKDVVKNA